MIEQRYLTISQAAAFMGMSVGALRKGIYEKPESIPPFVVLSNPTGNYRTIRFDKEDLIAFMNLRKNRKESFVITEVEK